MFPQLGFGEMILVMGVAVLLFGKKLPEVGRSLGRGIVEFKKGIRGIGDEDFGQSTPASSHVPATISSYNDQPEFVVPKFEPPTTAPIPHKDLEPQHTSD